MNGLVGHRFDSRDASRMERAQLVRSSVEI
jgi:hypothetical protein